MRNSVAQFLEQNVLGMEKNMKSNIRITAGTRLVCLFMAVIIFVSGCGSANTLGTSEESQMSSEDGDVSVDKDSSDIVAGGTEEEEDSDLSEITSDADTDMESEAGESEIPTEETDSPAEPELSAEELLWQTRLLANAKNNLNVRQEPSTDAKIVGKLDRGDYGIIVEKGEEWSKIISGKVEGYVYNKYCLFGKEAMLQAKEIAKTMATATVDNLRVRKQPNTSSKVVVKLMKGDKIEVNEDVEPVDGWIAVIYNEQSCYISADYLTIDVELSTGMTMEEIKEQKRLEEERKKAEAAASQKEKEKAAIEKASDLELLAALIFCEAGAVSYDAQLAVGACVMNRMKHKNFPDTLRGVIFQKNQFTPAGSGKVARILLAGKTPEICKKAAAAALAGEDNTNGCRSFRNSSSGRKGIVYGKLVFFSNN